MRKGDTIDGSYHVELPDGRLQVVKYIANEKGYHPIVTYENGKASALKKGSRNHVNRIQRINRINDKPRSVFPHISRPVVRPPSSNLNPLERESSRITNTDSIKRGEDIDVASINESNGNQAVINLPTTTTVGPINTQSFGSLQDDTNNFDRQEAFNNDSDSFQVIETSHETTSSNRSEKTTNSTIQHIIDLSPQQHFNNPAFPQQIQPNSQPLRANSNSQHISNHPAPGLPQFINVNQNSFPNQQHSNQNHFHQNPIPNNQFQSRPNTQFQSQPLTQAQPQPHSHFPEHSHFHDQIQFQNQFLSNQQFQSQPLTTDFIQRQLVNQNQQVVPQVQQVQSPTSFLTRNPSQQQPLANSQIGFQSGSQFNPQITSRGVESQRPRTSQINRDLTSVVPLQQSRTNSQLQHENTQAPHVQPTVSLNNQHRHQQFLNRPEPSNIQLQHGFVPMLTNPRVSFLNQNDSNPIALNQGNIDSNRQRFGVNQEHAQHFIAPNSQSPDTLPLVRHTLPDQLRDLNSVFLQRQGKESEPSESIENLQKEESHDLAPFEREPIQSIRLSDEIKNENAQLNRFSDLEESSYSSI